MRYTLSRPGAAPYLTVYARESQYAEGEIAPLGGTFETLRGDFCGQATLKFSAPPPFLAGDQLRVYLDGDPEDDPTYTGEMTGEPWEAGADNVVCRPLATTVSKAAWSGTIELRFAEYIAYALLHSVLPPGVTIGAIPADLTTLKASTTFEQLDQTMQAAMPAIENGAWGVDSKARVGVYRPDTTITHRFVLGEAKTPAGGSNDYANCVRFPYKQPDGTNQWFEVRIESEVAARGEVWDVVQVPASVTDAAENPLEGLNAGVSIGANIGGAAHPAVTTLPVFGPMWADTLSSPTPPQWVFSAGEHFTPATADESVITLLMGAGSTSILHLAVTADLRGQSLASALQVRGRAGTGGGWGSWNTPTVESGLLLMGSSDVQLRYTPAHVATYNPVGLRIDQGGYIQLYAPDGTPTSQTRGAWPSGSLPTDIPARDGSSQWTAVRVGLQPIEAVSSPAVNSTTLAETATITPTNDNTVTLPGPVLLQAGAAILVRDTSATVGTGVAGVKLITATGDKPLTAADAEGDMTKWTFPGPDVQVWGLRISGNPAKVGRIIARLTSTANLAAYGYGLLRYRVPVVRSWTGLIRELRRVPCRDVALFEVAGGDVPLDVQRCTYDLTAGTVTVEAGTPLASTDAAAVVGKIESIQRVVRTLKGGG